jgi:hypothetical protein
VGSADAKAGEGVSSRVLAVLGSSVDDASTESGMAGSGHRQAGKRSELIQQVIRVMKNKNFFNRIGNLSIQLQTVNIEVTKLA